MNSIKNGRKHNLDPKVLTDDMAYDDIVGASQVIRTALQDAVDTYNLTGPQLMAAITVAIKDVHPDDRLYAAVEGELGLVK